MLEYPSLNSEAVAIVDAACGWVVTEKVHGSNFQFELAEDGTLRVFSRNHPLRVPGVCEGAVDMSSKYVPLVERVRPCMRALGPGLAVFGELYGGAYPGHPHEGRPVQKEVLYCPTYEFVVFDVYDHATKSFWNWDRTRERCEAVGLRVVPELLRTPVLADVLEFLEDPEFHRTPSCVPERLHGLAALPSNVMEGVVVRPLVEPEEIDPKRGRGLYKVRTAAYREWRSKHPAQKTQAEKPISETQMWVRDRITRARMINAMSKELDEEFTPKLIAKYIPILVEDITKEWEGPGELDARDVRVAVGDFLRKFKN